MICLPLTINSYQRFCMRNLQEKWELLFIFLKAIESELKAFNKGKVSDSQPDTVFMPFRGAELYLLHKAFIDAGGAPNEDYKALLKRTAPYIGNKAKKGFSPESLTKYSDKVDPEIKENVKRFLLKMIRNIESYD
jgi:hypothetical protein